MGGTSDNTSAGIGGGAAAAGAAGVDACPDDPLKTQAGVCGCGVPEDCASLKTALLHRYSFSDTSAMALDSVSAAHGALVGTMLDGSGSLKLNGNGQYADLPNGILSALENATFEAWVTINPGNGLYARILDLGSSTEPEGGRGQGKSFLFLTPGTGDDDMMRVAYSLNGGAGEIVIDTPYIAANLETHVAVVFDDDADEMRLFRDGALKGMVTLTGKLGMIEDVNNWLGRSQFSFDADLNGSIHEFRIYGAALSSAELVLSAMLGPDPEFLK